MHHKKHHSQQKKSLEPFSTHSLHPFFNFPLLSENLWSVDFHHPTGFSISEDKKHVYVEAYLPGLKIDDIKMSFENGILWINGEKKEERSDKNKTYYKKASSSFSYRVHIPCPVDEKKEPIACYKDGVMKITFSKTNTHPKNIKIKK